MTSIGQHRSSDVCRLLDLITYNAGAIKRMANRVMILRVTDSEKKVMSEIAQELPPLAGAMRAIVDAQYGLGKGGQDVDLGTEETGDGASGAGQPGADAEEPSACSSNHCGFGKGDDAGNK